jgi:hypothetical protein
VAKFRPRHRRAVSQRFEQRLQGVPIPNSCGCIL